MDRIDGFLSQKAQRAYPDATVIVRADGTPRETWVLRRPGVDDLGLGVNFGEAKASVQALIAAVAKGENTILVTTAGGMSPGYEAFPVERVEREGCAVRFYSESGNPVVVKVSSPEQAKDAEAGVRHLMERPPRLVIRLGEVSGVVMEILCRRRLLLWATDGPAFGKHPGIDWSWGVASAMVSPSDKIVWLPDGVFEGAQESERDHGYVSLDLNYGYKDGKGGANIPDSNLRRVVVDFLNDRAKGRLMKDVLAWPVPVLPEPEP